MCVYLIIVVLLCCFHLYFVMPHFFLLICASHFSFLIVGLEKCCCQNPPEIWGGPTRAKHIVMKMCHKVFFTEKYISLNQICFHHPQVSLMENNTSLSHEQNNGVSFAIGAFILAIVFLLGVPGNLFIIWSILARARKRSVTTLIILNLACADCAIMFLTVFFIVYLVMQSWVFGRFMCKLLFYLCNTNMYASILLIMLMSVHRLVTVLRPQGAHFFTRKRNVLSILTMLWVLVFLLSIPALIFRDAKRESDDRWLCSHNHTDPKYVRTPLFLHHQSTATLQ